MHRNRRKRKLVIFSLIFVLLLMVTGYASFKSSLNIKGSSKVTSNWDVRITNIAKGTFNGSAEEATEDGVKVDPTCSESGTPKTCDTGLKAFISVDLYEAGDSAEYDITISNKGNIDAKLDDILIDNTNSNSAVLITYSGYSKGERLFKNGTPGNSKTIHVKVAYNPEYSGGEVSSEIDLTFEFVQAEAGTIPDTDTYVLTYDYQTNGGTKTNETANYDVGESVDLISHTDSRQGYSFVGWNTDSSATTALPTYNMPNSNSTLYAIYETLDNTPPVIDNISTTKTSSTITAVVTAHDNETGISKYEFSIDGGTTWIDNGNNNVYTFTGLNNNQTYTVDVRVTDGAGNTVADDTQVTTGLDVPTFVENIQPTKTDVEITYPEGCGTILTCTYQKNSETEVTLTSNMLTDNKYTVEFTDSGTVIAKVTEGLNYVSSSYTVDFDPTIVSEDEEYSTSGYTTFTAPVTGDYYLQVWGAQGGSYDSTHTGGKGGYSYGTVTLNEGDILYIYTGGQPTEYNSSATTNNTNEGGYNGGGTGRTYSYSGTTTYSLGGGGASDIRINSDSLYARVIVAGGGSGSSNQGNGYAGGGSQGLGYNDALKGKETTAGTGGSFGVGGSSGGSYNYKYGPPGGGGGWYGGGRIASSNDSNSYYGYAAGGGSGYVYTSSTASNYPSGCLLNSDYYLKNAATIAGDGSQSFESPNGGTESGHEGDGYVKITYDISKIVNQRLILTSSNVTTNSMTITGTLDPNITASKYEFSINNGETWIDNGTNNVYTFTGLNHNTTYHIKSRVTTPDGKVIAWVDEKTNEITEPTFTQTNVGMSDDIGITYPEGCGTTLTCTYQKNSASPVTTSTNPTTVNFADSGTLIATVSDGTNTVTTTYSVVISERYLITYDCRENGGTGDTTRGAEVNTNVDLTLTCSKDGYTFVGWNTDKDATTNLSSVVADSAKTLYGIYSKTINVTYTKGSRIERMSKNSDTCTVYNKTTSCNLTLPDIEATEPYYDIDYGFYINDTKIGDSEDSYSFSSSETVTSKATQISMMGTWPKSASATTDFHANTYRNNIITAEFLTTNTVPSEATASWDVSAVHNSGKVMAWVIPDTTDNTKYHLYIGGDGNIYASEDSSYLFQDFHNLLSVDLTNLNASKTLYMTYMFSNCYNLTTVNFANIDTSKVVDMSSMFASCWNLNSTDFSYLDTSSVINMSNMFGGCNEVTTLDLSDLDTSKVKDMSWMFVNCNKLVTLDITNWDTSNVQNMESMFSGCFKLDPSFLTYLDTDSVTNMKNMFNYCSSFTTIDLSNWDTGNVITMENMFYNCTGLTQINLNVLDLSSAENLRYMFTGCSNLSTVSMKNADLSNVTTMERMFNNCSSLSSIDLSGMDLSNVTNMSYVFYYTGLTNIDLTNINTNKVTTMEGMFMGCRSLTSIDLSDLDTGNLKNMYQMFFYAGLITVDLSVLDTSNVTNMNNLFSGCNNLTSVDLSDLDTSNLISMSAMFSSCPSLTSIDLSELETSNVTNMSSIFSGCSSLTSVDLSDLDTRKVTNISSMFYGCTSLTTIDLSDIDTSSVTDMANMFQNCSGLTTLDLSKFDTKKVTNMSYMFQGCTHLTTLNLSTFNTQNVTNMTYMFQSCSGLTSLNISNFNTEKVTNMSYMFQNCSSLTAIDVSSFDTEKVTDMSSMFSGCSSLTTLDLSNFDTSQVTRMISMFYSCSELTKLYFNNLDMTNVSMTTSMFSLDTKLENIYVSKSHILDKLTSSNEMFKNCTSLVGGNGTTYDSTKEDKSYARIDQDGRPGYFTDVNSPQISNIGTTTTSNSITMAVTATMPVQTQSITKYEFSIDNGSYIDNGTNNIYTFTGLTNGQQYKIKVRVTGSTGKTSEREIGVKGNTVIKAPTYEENEKNITVLYPTGCGSTYTCTYKKNNDSEVTVTDRNAVISIDDGSGTITGKVSDGTAEASSTYMYSAEPLMKIWDGYASTDFHNSTYKSKITSVEFLDTINIPSGATSWDVSLYGNGSVIAYVLDDGNSGYELYIAGNGNVKTDSTASLFSGFSKLSDVNLEKLDTSRATNMSYMFSNCTSLTSIDLSDLDVSNVTTMHQMFYYCTKLSSVNLSNLDASNVTTMNRMFSNCSSLTNVNFSNINTSKVTNMEYMFYNCTSITTLNLSDLDTGNVTSMYLMFSGCNNLLTLDVSNFDTSKVTTMESMFSNCSKLTTLNISSFDTSNVTNMIYMFTGCSSLTSLTVSNINTSNVVDLHHIFSGCNKLTTIDLSGWDTSNVTNMGSMFNGCTGLTSINLSFIDTSSATSMQYMFYGCTGLTTINISNFDTSKVTTMASMFQGCTGLTSIDLSSIDTTSVTTMLSMLSGCTGLTSINLTFIDASNLTTMKEMLKGCTGLQTVDLRGVNVPNLKDMKSIFSGCSNLTTIYFNNINTNNVTDISYMFNNCTSLSTINFSDFDTDSVTDISYMFSGCTGLTSIDLSMLNTDSLKYTSAMFSGCTNLTIVDLSNLKDNIKNTQSMFNNCSKLETIYVSSLFNTTRLSSSSGMFYGCTSLVGGNGTTYTPIHINATYARIDGISGKGYFTLKSNL